jgi:hypothetical protein
VLSAHCVATIAVKGDMINRFSSYDALQRFVQFGLWQ